LWYVSQNVEIEHGKDALNLMLDSLIAGKPANQGPLPSARPTY
jgi:hypothetical protein